LDRIFLLSFPFNIPGQWMFASPWISLEPEDPTSTFKDSGSMPVLGFVRARRYNQYIPGQWMYASPWVWFSGRMPVLNFSQEL
jgi:hypothetical protein